MAFKDELEEKAKQIRKLAVGRTFENDFYNVAWTKEQTGDYETDGWGPEAYAERLTLDRYLKGGNVQKDNNCNYYVQPGSETWNYLYDETAWVNDTLNLFGQGHPKKLEALLEQIADVSPQLCGDPDWVKDVNELDRPYGEGSKKGKDGGTQFGIDSITDSALFFEDGIAQVGEWSGEAAGTFIEGVGSHGGKWKSIAWRSYALAEVLRAGLEAQVSINASARADILSLASRTENVLLHVRDTFHAGEENVAALTIGGAIATTALSIASLGTASALLGAGITITTTVLNQMDTSDPVAAKAKDSDIKIEGASPREVLESFSTGVGKLQEKISQKEQDVADKIEQIYQDVVGSIDNYRLDFSDDSYDEEFSGNPDNADELGKPRLEVNPTMLKDAAKDSFPPAVDAILGANSSLAATSGYEEPAFASDHAPTTSPVMHSWIELRDLLQDFTAWNGEKVQNAGEVILQAAIEYADLDDDNADELQDAYAGHKPVESGRDHEDTVDGN